MMARLSDWYAALTARERLLVTVLGVIAGAILLVYGLILPLGRAHDAAHERQRAASEQAGRIMAGLSMLDNASKQAPSGSAEPLNILIASSAEAQGFTLQSNQPRGNDIAAIVIPSALPGPALAWLNALEARGIQLESLTMTPGADGSTAINAQFRRNGS